MSERRERIFEALSEISEQKIDEASPSDRTSRSRWKKWGVLVAALVLVVGVGSQILPRLGGQCRRQRCRTDRRGRGICLYVLCRAGCFR